MEKIVQRILQTRFIQYIFFSIFVYVPSINNYRCKQTVCQPVINCFIDSTITRKNVTLTVRIVNPCEKSFTIPRKINWGYNKFDSFSDLLVQLQELDSNNQYTPYNLVDPFLLSTDELVLTRYSKNDTIVSSRNIAKAIEYGFHNGKYRVRIKYNFSKYNKSSDLFSDWVAFSIE